MRRQSFDDPSEPPPVEAAVLAQLGRAIGAVQEEHRLATASSDVDMRGPVIMRVDHHAQPVDAEDGRHVERIA